MGKGTGRAPGEALARFVASRALAKDTSTPPPGLNDPEMIGSSPRPTLAVTSVYDVSRKMNCSRYTRCLDYATENKWSGFHCDACSFHKE
jgi:hypothetical protein